MFPTSAFTRQQVEEHKSLQVICNIDKSCKPWGYLNNQPQSESLLRISAVNYITHPKNQGLKSDLRCLGGKSRANLADDRRLTPSWADDQNWA